MQLSTATPSAAVKVDLTAFEYNEAGEKIATNSMDEVTIGYSNTFTANSRSIKVKLYVLQFANLEQDSLGAAYRKFKSYPIRIERLNSVMLEPFLLYSRLILPQKSAIFANLNTNNN